MQAVRARNVGTPDAGRLYAMVMIAMYNAVNGIDAAAHHAREHAVVPVSGAPVNGNRELAAASAAHAVLSALLPAHAFVFDAALEAELAAFEGGNAPPIVPTNKSKPSCRMPERDVIHPIKKVWNPHLPEVGAQPLITSRLGFHQSSVRCV